LTPSPERQIVPTTAARRWPSAAFALFLAAYFFWFNWEAVRAPFAADDPMNLFAHWRHPWRAVYANFLLWRDFYRPMGGWFYVPIFDLFGLQPAPFHAVLLALLLLYVGLIYRLARVLGAEALAAWLAALVIAYHAGLSNLYYETSHIYDVLCGIFYASALIVYAGARSQGRPVRGRRAAAFFALFLCALNSKEMAVTLPVMLLAYEWLYHAKEARCGFGGWLRGPGAVVVGSGVLTAVAIYGRVFVGLAHFEGYATTFSLARFAAFQRQQFQDLFFQWNYSGWVLIAATWMLATYLAWRTPRPLPRFCWVLTVVAPLPVEFLEGRSGAVLAIPVIGWAILAGVAAVGLARAIAGAIAGDPGFRRLAPDARLGVVLALFVLSWAAWNRTFYERDVRHAMFEIGHPTAEVIEQLRELNPRVRPHDKVVFLNDPFDAFDMAFIADLTFRDPTVSVRLHKKVPLTPEELAQADFVFDWRDGRLVKVAERQRDGSTQRH
jgi:hypothetical protein